ncbi:hypothetical protein [Streptomyces sp. NPDC057413]|uniref:ATP-dependent DNA ligase n=1 Tax=Streptomyces sp. NPDC057413 TaxID=3346124 RepID=UPI00368C0EE6
MAAAADLPDGLVLDGELVVWAGEGMSFEALQQRAAAGHLSAPILAQELPAHLIVFDVPQVGGQEVLQAPYAERRARLEQLFTDHDLHAPWALCPETEDPERAQEWLTSWTRVPGVEGLIIRGTEQRYLRGARALYKVRRRDSTEAIIGGITWDAGPAADAHPGPLRRHRPAARGRAQHAAAPDRRAGAGRAPAVGGAGARVGGRALHGVVGGRGHRWTWSWSSRV